MTTTDFPQSNMAFGPPPGLDENQVQRVRAYHGTIQRGSVEGLKLVVVAWQPTFRELDDLNKGAPIFLTCIGGLPAHFLTTNFAEAINPA